MKLFLLMFLEFFLLVANTRAYTQGNYLWTAITDGILLITGFVVTRKIVESKSLWDRVWYVAGGILGSITGIAVTKAIYGQ